MLYYQNIQNKHLMGGVYMIRVSKKSNSVHCPYCKGEGYFQLRLGGSETCNCCKGSGKNK